MQRIPQFEVNLSSEVLKEYLEKIYCEWEVIKYSVKAQQYKIPRERVVCLSANVVTFAARKPENNKTTKNGSSTKKSPPPVKRVAQ